MTFKGDEKEEYILFLERENCSWAERQLQEEDIEGSFGAGYLNRAVGYHG